MIAERSSISSTTESVQINESTCSTTSSPADDHSSHAVDQSRPQRREAVQDHLTMTQHKEAIKLEMMQRVSTFQKQVNEKHEVNENMLEKTFTAIYWLPKEEISNQKLIPLLELLENLGVSELTYFQHRSRPTVREMFITLGESIQEIILERIRRAKSFGILADEAADVAVLQQLIIFLKYINPDTGMAKTEFLATKA